MRTPSASTFVLLCLAGLGLAAGPASAAANTSPAAPAGTHEWRHTVALYALAAGMSGDAAIGPVGADVDVPFTEILENLEIGAFAAYRGTNGTWSVMVNTMFIGLGASKGMSFGGTTDVDIDQSMLEIDAGWRCAKHFEIYAGLRANSIDMNLEVRRAFSTPVTADDQQTWVDPLVGIRFETPIGSKWIFVARGDVGGFGVGSDIAWSAMTHFDWRISKHWGAAFGYAALDMDYEDGEGSDYFNYDILATGPFAAATFSF